MTTLQDVLGVKVCGACHEAKPLAEYWKRASAPDGLQAHCKDCKLKATRAWRRNNKDRVADYTRKARYGAPGVYNRLLAAQGGVCAICEQKCPEQPRLSSDMDPGTRTIRGLVCQPCRRGLKDFGRDAARLVAAIEYLKEAGE